jgi:hypothetical protein
VEFGHINVQESLIKAVMSHALNGSALPPCKEGKEDSPTSITTAISSPNVANSNADVNLPDIHFFGASNF